MSSRHSRQTSHRSEGRPEIKRPRSGAISSRKPDRHRPVSVMLARSSDRRQNDEPVVRIARQESNESEAAKSRYSPPAPRQDTTQPKPLVKPHPPAEFLRHMLVHKPVCDLLNEDESFLQVMSVLPRLAIENRDASLLEQLFQPEFLGTSVFADGWKDTSNDSTLPNLLDMIARRQWWEGYLILLEAAPRSSRHLLLNVGAKSEDLVTTPLIQIIRSKNEKVFTSVVRRFPEGQISELVHECFINGRPERLRVYDKVSLIRIARQDGTPLMVTHLEKYFGVRSAGRP